MPVERRLCQPSSEVADTSAWPTTPTLTVFRRALQKTARLPFTCEKVSPSQEVLPLESRRYICPAWKPSQKVAEGLGQLSFYPIQFKALAVLFIKFAV